MKYRPEYNLKIIGENLKRLRIRKGLTVEEVREYLRLGSVQAVYKYEQGRGYPQTDAMFALMELYDASLSDIIYKYEPIRCDCYWMDMGVIIEVANNNRTGHFKRIKRYYEIMRKGIAG